MKLWTDGRRTTEPAYTISSPGAFGSGELKSKKDIVLTAAILLEAFKDEKIEDSKSGNFLMLFTSICG